MATGDLYELTDAKYAVFISNLLPGVEFPTIEECIEAVFQKNEYIQSNNAFLSSSYCGMLELYLDYCKMKKGKDTVIDFDKERREYLSHRSASDKVIKLVKWFNGYYEGERFAKWLYQS
jgi:hypothetical protein